MTKFAFLTLAFLLAACARRSAFLERRVTLNNREYRYRVWLPAHYTKLHHWPVVLYLHGSGERGDDDVRQLESGLPPALEKFGQRYKCVVVIPQCADGHEWYGDMEQMALAALEETIREFHGNRRRVSVTGISMGGTGAWYFARHQRRFAAVVPIAGEIVRARTDPFPTDPPPDIARIAYAQDPYATLASEIGPTPVWAFHGAADDVVPVTESRRMVAALQRSGRNVRYTEYAGVAHNAWDRAYADPNVAHWMIEQKLR
jgi:predicted peptidase